MSADVLVVDVDPARATALATIFRARGLAVALAADAAAALAVLRAAPPLVVFLDTSADLASPLAVASAARAAGPALRLVSLSDARNAARDQREKAAGIEFQLTRPVDEAMLVAVLPTALRRRVLGRA